MSKNLTKASDWAQREIDDLKLEQIELTDQALKIADRVNEVNSKILILTDIKKQLSNGIEEEKPTV